MPKSRRSLTLLERVQVLPVFESSITDSDQRICSTMMQTIVSRVLVQTGMNVPPEECEDAFHKLEETRQVLFCLPCQR